MAGQPKPRNFLVHDRSISSALNEDWDSIDALKRLEWLQSYDIGIVV